MCFGGGGDSSSKEIVAMQKQEAAEARQKETERQARIQQGLTKIRQAFHGAPIMRDVTKHATAAAPGAGTVSGAAVSGLPAGYSYVQVPIPATTANRGAIRSDYVGGRDATQPGSSSVGSNIYGSGGRGGGGGGYQSMPSGGVSTGGGGMKWMIKGPDGQLRDVGSDVAYTGQEDTGQTTGGFDQNFYDTFKQKILDYYNPQVQEQFGKAANETLFRHARAGTTQSSGAIGTAADLTKQKKIQEGLVLSKADTAASELKDKVAKEEAAAENQLYATENPDVAANTATASVKNIAALNPDLTPLQQVFDVASIGGANFLKGLQNARYKQGGTGVGGYGATSIQEA
jgi:hypothetical protein